MIRDYLTDGYGDRPDMVLAKDREYNNRPPAGYTRWEDYHAAQKAKQNYDTYGSASSAKPISALVEAMLEAECYSKLLLKSEVTWPSDEDYTIHDAVEEACISLGLDAEEFSAAIHDQGNEIEIRLIA